MGHPVEVDTFLISIGHPATFDTLLITGCVACCSEPEPQRSPLVRYFDPVGISATPLSLVVRVSALGRLCPARARNTAWRHLLLQVFASAREGTNG